MLKEDSIRPDRARPSPKFTSNWQDQGKVDRFSDEKSATPFTKISSKWGPLLAATALSAIVAMGFNVRGTSTESQHANWKHVEAATDGSSSQVNQLLRVGNTGATELIPEIEIDGRDKNRAATRRVRSALIANDRSLATAHLQASQQVAISDPENESPSLTLDSPVAAALRDGRCELFEMKLYDCCDEDGDVVELDVNGTYFMTVPIMHAGSQISIPLRSGTNTITVRGSKDGGGGVTLAFTTSRGHFFARHMHIGEEYQFGVLVK